MRLGHRLHRHVRGLNLGTQGILNQLKKRVQDFRFTLGNEFNAAIAQVGHEPGNLEIPGKPFRSVSKADTLDPARVKNAATLPDHTR